ncbi:MAG TPA: hydrophobe/amphiphile efflux-1 family RND transporter [Planctomycetaceae bacterium]|nr:hydrophobe/amphiphile efflux-1 family RND transporter [Planctomycetaceae bacterium]HRE98952.1 multidrug efflux RND transporter permease subunit [Pirellulaceae bacterium]
MSRFFIRRPIFASVISIVIVIAGLVAQSSLPVAKYPEISPPTVQVRAIYPGANARVVAETVAAVIEKEVNGVEGMLYMSSVSGDDGSYVLTVTFDIGVDLDMATVLVQNRVAIAESRLPEEARRQGVTTKKQSTAILQFVALVSDRPEHDGLFLSNVALREIRDELTRIDGVGDVVVFGVGDYGMRVWLDPPRLRALSLTAGDVVAAIREQNVQVAAGRIGQPPAPDGTPYELTVNTRGRLTEAEEFADLIVKSGSDGQTVRVRDVARVELAAQNLRYASKFRGQPSASLAIYQLPGANALDVAAEVRRTMERLATGLPEGVSYRIPFDSTAFVNAAISEVYVTLFQAVALVVLVIFVFLQDWRTTLIPCAAIPVSLIGIFAVMAGVGYSINMITLFGVVLAIGIVVDDAIVVVENVARLIDSGMKPRDAAERAMEEITGPVIATTLVLLAVFIPTAFLGGIVGQLYRQFALTISGAVVISTINALTLSPALCGLLMRPTPKRKFFLFERFDRAFDVAANGYERLTRVVLRKIGVTMVLFLALLMLTGWGFGRLPTGFLPTEDQGYCFINLQLPDAASLERTEGVLEQVEAALGKTPGVRDWLTIGGYSMLSGTSASNSGFALVIFEPWDERTSPETRQEAIVGQLRRSLSTIRGGIGIAFTPPPIDGLGNAGGFQLQILDRSDLGPVELAKLAREMVDDGNAQSGLRNLNTTFRATVPQLYVDVDRTKVKSLDVPLDQVFATLQTSLGSSYANDFNAFGQTYQVRVQADHGYRAEPEDILRLDVRSRSGAMIPLGALAEVRDDFGPQSIVRYNNAPSAAVTGEPAPGRSSGQAMDLMEQMAEAKFPSGVGYAWTGMAFQEREAGSPLGIFALAVVFVFLVLAAQYESWSMPAAVIAVVPLSVLGVVVALATGGMDNNTYTQIGIVLLVALASKNAILIVEFAAEERRRGLSIIEAAANAARLRFRPILMTALSSVLGFLPLLTASGAGAASRQAVGAAVVGGMIAAIVFSLAFVPAFFVVFRREGGTGEGERTSPSPDMPDADSRRDETKEADAKETDHPEVSAATA